MVASKVIVSSVLVAGAAASISPRLAEALAARAIAPGTDLYNCHDNCGQAILEIEYACDVCTDSTFLADYANCLICAGSDNDDIWKYYGSSLTSAAAECGLSTTPLTASAASIGAAITKASYGNSTATYAASGTGAATTTSSSIVTAGANMRSVAVGMVGAAAFGAAFALAF